jgi:hypothetical protein
MKWKGQRQSSNVDIQTEEQRIRAEAAVRLDAKVKDSPRQLSPEAVAYNQDKSPKDRVAGAMNNPGRSTPRKAMGIGKSVVDPAPEKLTKAKDLTRSDYDEVPFFQHKSVPNVYKEPK